MLVIWSRWGILAVLIFIASLFATQAAVDRQLGKGFYTQNYWPKAAAFVAGSVVTWIVGFALNRREPTWATKHRLFFLPMEYWAFIVLFITACISYGEFTGK